MNTNTVITGSIKELAGRVSVGGIVLGQPELSTLTRLGQAAGFARVIDTIRNVDANGKPARGKPGNIWEINLAASMSLVVSEVATAPVTDVVADEGDAASQDAGSVDTGDNEASVTNEDTGETVDLADLDPTTPL